MSIFRLGFIAIVALGITPRVFAQQAVSEASGAYVRGLDKVDGSVRDFDMAIGESVKFGSLKITLDECRFPVGNPAGDGFAYIEIRETSTDKVDFKGWMIASAPALDALDHPRYDVWLLRCKIK